MKKKSTQCKTSSTPTETKQTSLDVPRNGSGASGKPFIHHDLDFMAGSWIKDEKCEQALAEFDQLDEGIWR